MHSNCVPNYYCYSDLCSCQKFYCIPTSTCYPSCSCCCPVCRQRNKPKSTKMSLQPKAISGVAAVKKTASKLKNKTIKAKRMPRNETPIEQTNNRKSVTSQGIKSLNSDKPLNSHHSLHSSNTSLRNSCCFSRLRSSGTRSEKTDSKQTLNMNIPFAKYPVEKKGSVDSNKTNHLRTSTASNQSKRQQLTNLENMEQTQSFVNNSSYKNNQPRCCSKIQPTRKCNCCNKIFPMNAGSPNASRHSFSGTKSCSQLDVIDEEDIDVERNRRQRNCFEGYAGLDNFCDAEAQPENNQRHSTNTGNRNRPVANVYKQKSLEDSCADFLNIVCDNIMESVQESIDCKLKVFASQTAEKFKSLQQKLDQNETAMTSLIQDLAEKMTEQNNKSFEDFYLRIQKLVEKQNPIRSNETQDEERPSSEPEQNEENISIISEHFSNNENKICENDEDFLKCASCDCCFEAENVCQASCGQKTSNAPSINSSDHIREMGGGCLDYKVTQRPAAKGNLKSRDNCPEVNLNQKPKSLNDCTRSQIFCLPPTMQNFCITPSGKITLKCNSSFHRHDWGRQETTACAAKNENISCHKNSLLKFNASSIGNDNYDTSGYATEPEDNSEATGVNSGRKKLLKKSVKQFNLDRQNSVANSLQVYNNNNACHARNDVSERSSSQTIKRLSRSSLNSCHSSPTRLSRL